MAWGLLLALLGRGRPPARPRRSIRGRRGGPRRAGLRRARAPQTVAGARPARRRGARAGRRRRAAPTLALQAAAIAGGAYLVFFGVTELLALLQAQASAPGPRPAGGARWRWPARVGVVAVAAVVVVVVVTGSEPEAAPLAAVPAEGCNGSKALCDRQLNEVAFAGTHNSFSAADSPGWYIANQLRTIRASSTTGSGCS